MMVGLVPIAGIGSGKTPIVGAISRKGNVVWFNFFLVGFTGLLAVIGAGQCYLIFRTLKATEIAADAAKGALIATARPRIIVRKVEAIFQMPPNRSVSAQFAITNVGGSRTVLIERNAILDTSYRQRGYPFPKYVGSAASNEHWLESGEPLYATANFADPRTDPSEENIPIEDAVREAVRGVIERIMEEELDATLSRPRYGRRKAAGSIDDGAACVARFRRFSKARWARMWSAAPGAR